MLDHAFVASAFSAFSYDPILSVDESENLAEIACEDVTRIFEQRHCIACYLCIPKLGERWMCPSNQCLQARPNAAR